MSNKKPNNNKDLSARLMAVQAYYQNLQNQKPIAAVVHEYLERGLEVDLDMEENDEQKIVKPQGALFKRILQSLDARRVEVNELLEANINKKEVPVSITPEPEEGDASDEVIITPPPPEKEMEPLLKAILLCGIGELLCHQDIDTALIIDDYLNVTHSFYEKGQVSFVNGVLDKVATLVR